MACIYAMEQRNERPAAPAALHTSAAGKLALNAAACNPLDKVPLERKEYNQNRY